MNAIRDAAQAAMKKAIELAPDRWMPGGKPDPLIREKHGHVGTPVSRLDGRLKVRGQARFAAEVPMPGLTYAAFAYSTIAKGRIVSIDTAAAEQAPGVALVMTHRNAPPMKPMPAFGTDSKGFGPSDLMPLQDDRIHWNGQPIAVVLADSQEQADHAALLVRASYAEEQGATAFAAAAAMANEPPSVLGQPARIEIGDADAALAASAQTVDLRFTTPRHNHNPIELHAATVAWDGDELTVHDASQALHHSAYTLAKPFGLDPEQVHVSSPYVGGGFGSKGVWYHHPLAAAAAKLAKRPVRVTLSRAGVYRLVGGRTQTEQRVAIGADAAGKFTAIVHEGTTTLTAHNSFAEQFTFATRHAYAAETFRIVQRVAEMNMVANTFMRAPGESIGTFALESAVDALAEKLGMDPIELRILNEPELDPIEGIRFSSRHVVQAWRDGAARFGWDQRKATLRARREGEWWIGMGCATCTYPYMRMPGGAATITLRADGSATVGIASADMGMGTATTHTLIAADRLGLPLDRVTVDHGRSELAGTFMAGGSSQTASIGAAVLAAWEALAKELVKLAGNGSPLAGLGADELVARDAGLTARDTPERWESYAAILARADRSEISVEAEAPPPLEMQHWSMHSHGAMFAEVAVNAVTGETRVRRFLGSFDCGRILNPKTAASQFRGGIVMGLGLALMEETQFDERSGRIMNPSLAEYHVPVHMDVPEIDVIWTDIPDPHTPMGARGVGEIGITGVGAAVANAIYNATGKRVTDLPITLDKTL